VWQVETIAVLKPGDTLRHAGFEVSMETPREIDGPNFIAERGKLTFRRDGTVAAVLEPERRVFKTTRRQTTEAAIKTTLLADIYATLGESDGKGGWTVRLYYNPLAPWIWLGAAFCALGGFVSLTDRRLRIGAPTRVRPVAQPAE
jgi:cytochrome c-type biogenesis protein CcmF